MFITTPGTHDCLSGICSIALTLSDDRPKDVVDTQRFVELSFVLDGNTDPLATFLNMRSSGSLLRREQLDAIVTLNLSAWQPDTFGSVEGVSCIGSSTPCPRL